MKSSRTWLFALGGIGLCLLLLVGILIIAAMNTAGGSSRPLVQITGSIPERSAVVGQPVVVFAEARDPGGIARVELWVNGEKAGTQENPNPGAQYPFETSQAWIPNGVGDYLLTVKAINRAGGIGESDPALIQAGARSFEGDPQTEGEYVVGEGDTWESIAGGLGIPVDELRGLNPDVDALIPGEGLRIPPRPEGEPAGDAAELPGGGAFGDAPRVDPPGDSPPPAPAADAEPESRGVFFGVPIPGLILCVMSPELCAEPIDGVPAPFPRPDGVSAGDPETGCGVDVFWYDFSENESGFRLYRFSSRPRFRMDLLEIFGPSAGSGTHLHYLDTAPPNGEFFYAVAAYNAGGETWSPPSPTHTSEGCRTEFVALMAVVEALEMNVGEGYDRLYCYASLADAPFVRIPHGASSFITLDAGTWNIAEHFSGSNKRPVAVFADNLNLAVECLGWQGENLVNLGRFTRSHPPEEWDGRLLNATSDSGGFSAVYRINEGYETIDDATGRTEWPLVDGSLPVPYNLREFDHWEHCERIGEGALRCMDVDEASLTWDYTVSGTEPRYPAEYKVYLRQEGEDGPRHYHTAINTARSGMNAPLEERNCHRATFYSVSAVVANDPLTGEPIESAPSAEFRVPGRCAALEITLQPFWVYGVDDGDPCSPLFDCRNDYEAYGWITLNGQRLTWNDHCDPGLFGSCMRRAPLYTAVVEATEYDWADMSLNTGGGWRRGNNVVRIPITGGEPLVLSFLLWDHDDIGDDHVWCSTRGQVLLEGRSAAEWLAVDQDMVVGRPRSTPEVGNCELRIHVRGVPGE